MGLVTCFGGTHYFNNCTFDYTGGATFGSGPVTKWSAINVYSETRYKTTVNLTSCNLIGCTTFKNHGNSTLIIK